MKLPLARFEFYLSQLEAQLKSASKEDSPGLWLYNNKARTTVFMLESLAKLYAAIYESSKLGKIKSRFKLLEDTLGKVDHYDCFAREFENNPGIPANITKYMQVCATKNILELEDILADKKWTGKKADRLDKIRNSLKEIDWMKPANEMKSIEKYYRKTIDGIKESFHSTGDKFTELEDGLHELRRELRWLSIYVQSLQGSIQLTDNAKEDPATIKYLVPEIVNSPYNKIPDAGSNRQFLLLEKKYFLALSWLVDALGKLKDKGLKLVAVAEAIEKTEGTSHEVALHKATQLLGFEENALQSLLDESSEISRQFFIENNLDKMIVGTSVIEK